LRKAALDEIRAAKARVPGTADEKELEDLLLAYEQYPSTPQVELKAAGTQRDVIVNGDRIRASLQVHEQLKAPGWMEALASAGSFHPAVAEKMRELGGLPMKGTLRYTLFLDRIVEQFEVTSAVATAISASDSELPKGWSRARLRGFEGQPLRVLSRPSTMKQSFQEDDADKPKSDGGE